MKNFLLLIPSILISGIFSVSSAQIVSKGYSTSVMKSFGQGNTYAVLTNDSVFNRWFRSTLQKQWTVSSLQFIPEASLDTAVISDKNFFLFTEAKDDKTAVLRLLTSDDIVKKKEF